MARHHNTDAEFNEIVEATIERGNTELSDATARDRLIDSRIHLVRAMKELDRDGARRAQALTASAIVAVDDALRERPPNSTTVTPAGDQIDYWDSVGVDGESQRRRYEVNGEKCLNVTTVLNILAKEALLGWVERLTRDGRDWRQERDRAAERGARDRLIDSRIHLVRAMKELDRDGARRAQALTASAIVAVDDALREFDR